MSTPATALAPEPHTGSFRAAVQPLIAGRWLDLPLFALALLAAYATPLLTLRLTTTWSGPRMAAVAGACTLVFAVFVLWLARRLPACSACLTERCARLSLPAILALGLLLRLGWMLLFPAEPGSDGAIYTALARQLVEGQPYEISGTSAYWPVGYPLFLAAWMSMLGTGKAAWLVSNLVLFVVACWGVGRLAGQLGGTAAGRLAALLFAVWPNLLTNTATPEKEMVVVALLPWVCLVIVGALRGAGRSWHAVPAGLMLGACVLVQPALQFLLPTFWILLLVGLRPTARALLLCLLLGLGAALAIAPWTLRNYQVFGQFVLVSTNGGDNFYRANNPQATGGYTKRGEIDLGDLGELERDREGKRLAMEWIKSAPADFAALIPEKQARFMGDDAAGVYGTFKVGGASDDNRLYAALKALANAWWLAMWAVLAAAALALRNRANAFPALARLPLWLWLYLFTLHSVFESAGKYHVPMLWVLPVLLGSYLAHLGRQDAR